MLQKDLFFHQGDGGGADPVVSAASMGFRHH